MSVYTFTRRLVSVIVPPGARGGGPAAVAREEGPGRRRKKNKTTKTPASRGLPGFTAAAGRRGAAPPPAWPAPGQSCGPPPSLASGASALLSSPGRPGRPEGGRAALRGLPPGRGANSGAAGHCPAPAPTMMSTKPLPAPPPPPPPPQAAAAMFSFLTPGPATAAGGSALPLQASHADRRLPLPQLLPRRGRLREPPVAGRPGLLEISVAAAAASSVFLTEPKPPPSWFAPQ